MNQEQAARLRIGDAVLHKHDPAGAWEPVTRVVIDCDTDGDVRVAVTAGSHTDEAKNFTLHPDLIRDQDLRALAARRTPEKVIEALVIWADTVTAAEIKEIYGFGCLDTEPYVQEKLRACIRNFNSWWYSLDWTNRQRFAAVIAKKAGLP